MYSQFKKVIIIAFSIIAFSSAFAQDNNPLVDSKEAIAEGIELHDKEQYSEALKKYALVSRNDTNYLTALYEATFSYAANKEYKKAIEFAKEGLKTNSSSKHSFYVVLGAAYDDSGDSLKALETYLIALKEFPNNYLLHYNTGITYEKLKKYDQALAAYQKAIGINLYHASSHLRLGMLMANQGNLVPAILSLNMFLSIEGNSDRSYAALMTIQDIVQAKFDSKIPVTTSYTGDVFKEIDVMINSRIALNEKYKSKIKLRYPTTLQTQLLLEKLEYNANEKDFWMQTYVPFFKSIYNENKFEPFAYNLLSSVNVEEAQKWLKKNQSKLKEFATWAVTILNNQRNTKTILINGSEKLVSRTFYEKGDEYGIGESKLINNAKEPVGLWVYYYQGSYKMSEINYNQSGKKEGKATYYHSNGAINSICNFKNGELEGNYELYNEKGILINKVNYTNGELDGLYKEYYITGQLHTERLYKNGKKHGAETEYFIDGAVKIKANYTEGEIEGEAIVYFNSGKIDWKSNFKASKRHGPFVSYFENGTLATKGEYLNGEYTGKWEIYYKNGKLKENINYNSLGKIVGEIKIFDTNGKLEEHNLFNDKGEYHGACKSYNVNTGKVYTINNYENDKLKSTQYFDENGKQTEEFKFSKGKTNVIVKNEEGTKIAEGEMQNFVRNGIWKFYNKYGKLSSFETYKDGVLSGNYTSYYETGNKHSEIANEDGVEHGYFKSFYNNGKLKAEGWYQYGAQVGTWIYYHPNGKLKEKAFFENNSTTGFLEEYSVIGTKAYESKYWSELLEEITFFDTTGKVISNNIFDKGTGEEKTFFANKKVRKQSIYKNSLAEGETVWNYSNGKINSKFTLKAGKKDGKFVNYFENGVKGEEGNYKFGNKVGEWKYYTKETGVLYNVCHFDNFGNADSTSTWYYPNGKVETKIHYKNDLRDGAAIYYSEQGDLVIEKTFKEGDLVAYSYLKADGKKVEEKIGKGVVKIKAYYQNGKVSAEEDLVDGFYEGKRIQYYPNGSLQQVRNYINNVQEGEELNYYPNGKVKSSENYLEGELDGIAKYYRMDGKLEREEFYILDEKHGDCKYYDVTGKLIKTVKYNLNVAE